jgi:hypothetical protein
LGVEGALGEDNTEPPPSADEPQPAQPHSSAQQPTPFVPSRPPSPNDFWGEGAAEIHGALQGPAMAPEPGVSGRYHRPGPAPRNRETTVRRGDRPSAVVRARRFSVRPPLRRVGARRRLLGVQAVQARVSRRQGVSALALVAALAGMVALGLRTGAGIAPNAESARHEPHTRAAAGHGREMVAGTGWLYAGLVATGRRAGQEVPRIRVSHSPHRVSRSPLKRITKPSSLATASGTSDAQPTYVRAPTSSSVAGSSSEGQAATPVASSSSEASGSSSSSSVSAAQDTSPPAGPVGPGAPFGPGHLG